MASLRLKFPEKEEPSVIVLSGSRVTLGRLPLNTIQIIDRTLSGFHAEFVLEEDHFRLHDRGSTNGTFVNGESVTDFHLREACKIAFGALECEFSPETLATPEQANVEALPTRSEINAVRQENAELKNRAESLREELETLRKTRATETGANTIAVAQEEYDKLLAEREQLKESQHALQQEIARLKIDLSVVERDRENLKKAAASTTQAEFASFRDEPKPAQNPAPEPAAPAIEEPVPATENIEPPKVDAMPPPMPSAPAVPAPLPKPSFPLPGGVKPAPKPPGTLPGVPVKMPVAAGSGVRPVGVPSPAAPAAATPANPPTVQLPKPPLKPVVRAQAPVAKGGTQRIDADAVTPVKPVPPAGTLPMKPPVKLPLQPTVKLQAGTPLPRAVPARSNSNDPADEKSAAS
jgi:pSer/pThr/pTyr-binding forkhead associated (FHA) protein